MKQSTTLILLAVLVSQTYAAPQFISFKDGAIGVNFAGYHASAGLGGLLGGGAGGGLFAEAGTPHGQSARAGLGGAVDSNGAAAGGLYAGATAGGNVRAAAGLEGGVSAEKSAGVGYAGAQAGNSAASAGLGGETSLAGSSGFSFSGSKSFGFSSGVGKTVNVQPVETVEVIQPVEVVKPVYKKVHTDVQVDVDNEARNEVKPFVPLAPPAKTELAAGFEVKAEAPTPPTVVVKEVYVEPPPTKVVHKEIYRTHYKPRRHHFRKTAYIGGYLGGGLDDVAPPPPAPVVYKTVQPVVYKTVQPVIQKRIDVGVDSSINAGAAAAVDTGAGAGQYSSTYTKQIAVQRNPTFFADIFNIPISTLKAVGNFLGNAAGSTNISVQKSASVQAGGAVSAGAAADTPISKHASTSSSDATVSIQTPSASKIIDDILAIPINTLGAVNKFLENNVPARKNIQVTENGEPTKVRLGPHARRRANRVVVVEQPAEGTETSTD